MSLKTTLLDCGALKWKFHFSGLGHSGSEPFNCIVDSTMYCYSSADSLKVLCCPFLIESHEEATDYNTALIKQLGIGRVNPRNKDDYQEPAQEDNIDVQAGSLLETPKKLMSTEEWKSLPQLLLEPLNCVNSSQGTQSSNSLPKALTQNFGCWLQEPLLISLITEALSLVYEWTMSTYNMLWTNVEPWADKIHSLCQVNSSVVKYSCHYFSCEYGLYPWRVPLPMLGHDERLYDT